MIRRPTRQGHPIRRIQGRATLGHFALLAGFAALALLAACGSPASTYYTLSPVNGATHATQMHTIVLRQIALARYLERPSIVLSSADNQVALTPNDLWGEPLGAMLGRVMVEELSQRLPGSVVLSDTGAISAPADAVVELNVLRLDADPSGTIVLRAQFAISRNGKPGTTRAQAVELRAQPPGPGLPGAVRAMSDAVGQLADRIAAEL